MSDNISSTKQSNIINPSNSSCNHDIMVNSDDISEISNSQDNKYENSSIVSNEYNQVKRNISNQYINGIIDHSEIINNSKERIRKFINYLIKRYPDSFNNNLISQISIYLSNDDEDDDNVIEATSKLMPSPAKCDNNINNNSTKATGVLNIDDNNSIPLTQFASNNSFNDLVNDATTLNNKNSKQKNSLISTAPKVFLNSRTGGGVKRTANIMPVTAKILPAWSTLYNKSSSSTYNKSNSNKNGADLNSIFEFSNDLSDSRRSNNCNISDMSSFLNQTNINKNSQLKGSQRPPLNVVSFDNKSIIVDKNRANKSLNYHQNDSIKLNNDKQITKYQISNKTIINSTPLNIPSSSSYINPTSVNRFSRTTLVDDTPIAKLRHRSHHDTWENEGMGVDVKKVRHNL